MSANTHLFLKSFALTGLLLFRAILCHAQEFTVDLTNLETATQQEDAKSKESGVNRGRTDRGSEFDRTPAIIELRMAIGNGDLRMTNQLLTSLLSQYHSEDVRNAVSKLQATLKSQREEKQKREADIASAAIDAARAAVEKAKTPADLDEAIVALDRANELVPVRREDFVQNQSQSLQTARQFVIGWQDYLSYLEAGNRNRAADSLENLSRITANSLVPRSTILQRLNELRPPTASTPTALSGTQFTQRLEAIMAGAKTLDDVPDTITAIAVLASERSMTSDTLQSNLRVSLAAIRDAYADYKLGLPAILDLGRGSYNIAFRDPESIRLTQPLRTQLLRLVSPRFLRVEESVRPDEPIEDYLDRVMAKASEQLDARVMSRVVELRAKLKAASNETTMPPALQALLAAQNQEEAGQFLPAVVAYQKALNLGGEIISAKAIGLRLDAIKAAHPTEYEQGLKFSLSDNSESTARPQRRDFYNGSGFSISVPGTPPPAKP